MRRLLAFILIIFIWFQAGAQNIETLSEEICDSINSVITGNDKPDLVAQFKIQQGVLKNHAGLFEPDTTREGLTQANHYLHGLVRALSKNCANYELEQNFLSGETTVLDVEHLFSKEQVDTIQSAIKKLIKDKNFGVLIVSVDDLFPYKNIKDFAIGQGAVWSIGGGLSKGGIVVAFSKKLKRVRISTSSLSKQYLPDDEAQSLIDKVLLPKFSRGQYYEAIIEMVKKLEVEL